MAYIPRKKAKGKRVYAKRKGLRKPARKTITKVVKQVLSRQVEVKHTSSNPQNYLWSNASGDNSLPFTAVNLASLYSIPPGDEDGARAGNKIYVKKCDLCFNASATNSPNTGPFIMDCWIGYCKPQQAFPPTSTQQLRFLQDGNSATYQDQTTLQLLRNVNKDLFTIVAHKRFKLGTSEATGIVHSNNDFSIFRNFRIPIKKLLGTMKFDDATSNPSKYMYMWFHCVRIDSVLATTAQLPTVHYYVDFNYTDM